MTTERPTITPTQTPLHEYDPLTGAYTRGVLQAHFERELTLAAAQDSPLTILLIDIDHFKSINDAFGHQLGDSVLAEIIAQMRSKLQGRNLLFRYGGDEFVVLLPGASLRQATILAESLRAHLQATPVQAQTPLNITISIGIASYPDDGQTALALFETADRRHYAAKRAGRNQVVASDQQTQTKPSGLSADSRIVGRDQELSEIQDFLAQVGQRGIGSLQLLGPDGIGKTRLMAEAQRIAGIQGYYVMPIQTTPALRGRVYGALQESQHGWPNWPTTDAFTTERLLAILETLVANKNHLGVLLTIDPLAYLDSASLELLRGVISQNRLPRLAIIYSAAPSLQSVFDIGYHTHLTLNALTTADTRVLLRQTLGWNPPDPANEWLHNHTAGIPGQLDRAIWVLINGRILQQNHTGQWDLTPHYLSVDLSHLLAAQPKLPPTNLPTSLSDLVGRSSEIAEIKHLLQSRRLVTLLGPGGIGKTRLALQVAAELHPNYPDGVYVIPLENATSIEDLFSALSAELYISTTAHISARKQIVAWLDEKRLLLVLDTFENLTNHAQIIDALLEGSPNLQLLITSREKLNLPDEAIYPLAGLPYPTSEDSDAAEQVISVQLFKHRAQHAQGEFKLTAENIPAVSTICQLMNGLPLGIELAAAWVYIFTPESIVDLIKQGAAVIPAADESQNNSLQAMFGSIWNLLSPSEQQTLQRFSVFQSGFTLYAAQNITGASSFFIAALAEKSLIQRLRPTRYQMHELLRQFLADKLHANPEEAAQASQRHCEYYASGLATREARLRTDQQLDALEDLDLDLNNILAAWQWATHSQNLTSLNQLLSSLTMYYFMRGRYYNGYQVIHKARITLQSKAPLPEQTELYTLTLQRLLVYEAFLTVRTAAVDEYVALLLHAIPIFEAHDDQATLAIAHMVLGMCYRLKANLPLARHHLEESLLCYSLQDERWFIANTLDSLAIITELEEDYKTALMLYQYGLTLLESSGEAFMRASLLVDLADCLRLQEQTDAAEKMLHEVIGVCQQFNEQYMRGVAYGTLAQIAEEKQNYLTARHFALEAMRFAQASGVGLLRFYSCNLLGKIAFYLNDLSDIQPWSCAALDVALEINSPPFVLETFLLFARLAHTQADAGYGWLLAEFVRQHPITQPALRTEATDFCTGVAPLLVDSQLEHATRRLESLTIEEIVSELQMRFCAPPLEITLENPHDRS